jgi:hypothetical protein
MQFWQMDPSALDPTMSVPEGHRREVVLWDMGGQDEYRLVHQLFLRDTTLALVFLDPTRGRTAYEEVEAWNARLEKQLSGQGAVKLLVGAKVDEPSETIDQAALRALVARCGFAAYFETSALTERGLSELREAIVRCLNWDSLASTSRPELFQRIRDKIEQRRTEGEVVLPFAELETGIYEAELGPIDPGVVGAVARQLAAQGVIVDTRLSSGERILVLRIEEIESYAGALILAARNNPRGVPALEERSLGLPSQPLPGIKRRLPRLQEVVVLECVAELLVEHGICLRHEGLLVFPSLFPEPAASPQDKLAHSISLYYDFTGAIDNIYASLVARLAMSKQFGEQRLWPNRVEFDEPGKGICGIQQVRRKSGLAHLDLFFGENTDPQRRSFFIRFIESHLREQGVEVREHQAIQCSCGYEIVEEIVQANIARGEADVLCPVCRTQTLISEGVQTSQQRDHASDRKIIALRKQIADRTRAAAIQAKHAVSAGARQEGSREAGPIRILHLSDLHFTRASSPAAKLQWLADDLRKRLQVQEIEYLVISGDMTDKGGGEGFERAREFASHLREEFGLSAQRCVFVPGNHDVQDHESAFDVKYSKGNWSPGTWVQRDDIYLVQNEKYYPQRLKAFSDAFFHKLIQEPYPLQPELQGTAYLFPETGIQFLALNSCWQIDRFNRKRSGVHPDAVAHTIREADRQVREAKEAGRLAPQCTPLRIGVWHHAVTGPEMMQNSNFIAHLQNSGVKLCLHGDVHEMRREQISYWDEQRRIHIVGAGSFGSPAEGRPESEPRLYNLLEISRDLRNVRVHTRCQRKEDGTWGGWNEWPRPDSGDGALPYFDLAV